MSRSSAGTGPGRARAPVAMVGPDRARAGRAEARIAETGSESLVIAADLRDPACAGDVVGRTVERFGQIDALAHVAGIFRVGPFASGDVAGLDEQYAVHVRAPYAVTAAALPHMAPGSAVTMIGSNLATNGMPGAVG